MKANAAYQRHSSQHNSITCVTYIIQILHIYYVSIYVSLCRWLNRKFRMKSKCEFVVNYSWNMKCYTRNWEQIICIIESLTFAFFSDFYVFFIFFNTYIYSVWRIFLKKWKKHKNLKILSNENVRKYLFICVLSSFHTFIPCYLVPDLPYNCVFLQFNLDHC